MSISTDIQKPEGFTPTTNYDVVVVGAGPYGLSTAAHLIGRGLHVAVFGKPLQLWREHMPEGMLLRSYWWASNLSDPQKKYGLAQYFQAHAMDAPDPLSIETFIDYALWFQRNVVPNVDETYVANIEYIGNRFELTLEDGRTVSSRTIVMAPGLYYYVYRPAEYDHLSAELVSHASAHYAFDRFADKRVVVIGGGQSALESAALLNESGAKVDVISRSPLHWLISESVENRTLIERLRSPRAGIAPGWFNWGLENMPYAFQQLPRAMKDTLMRGRGRFGPAGASWLKPRIIGEVVLHEGQSVKEVKEADGGVVLVLSNNEVLHADHVLLTTGYRVNIWNLPMLHPSLVSKIRTYRNAPILNNRFESNVPGLYFVGISSVASFGPFYRFVVGTDATARRVTGSVMMQIAQRK